MSKKVVRSYFKKTTYIFKNCQAEINLMMEIKKRELNFHRCKIYYDVSPSIRQHFQGYV